MARSETRLYPALLRHWRTRRGMSQLDLALAADVSPRHVSFLETGRAQPSREMVLRLGSTLTVPLRDQNEMLRAAGLPSEFAEPRLEDGLPGGVGPALERMLRQHEPFPMVVFDRHYDLLRANEGAMRLFGRLIADPTAMPARQNVLLALFDPRLVRPFVVEWERVARGMTARLHRETLLRSGDVELAGLLRAIFEYPGVPESWRQPDFSIPSEATLTLHFRRDELELAFLTTLTVFNAPQNVTLEELCIESYFPLDDRTERACARLAAG
jgi:transcriptional regulator with XRE-family HTH domain